MKKIVITQYGREELESSRTFVVEFPDDVDPETLDETALEALADEAGISWETDESSGVSSEYHDIECGADELFGFENYPVIRWHGDGCGSPKSLPVEK